MRLALGGEIEAGYANGTSVTVGQGGSLVVPMGEKHRSCSRGGSLVVMFKARDLFVE
jgi:mannose-6-phosphate isomerase-like protein (cupin superfamily)